MPTPRQLKRRIEGVATTRSVTNAMKLVATARLGSAQRLLHEVEPYAAALQRMVYAVVAGLEPGAHPLLRRPGRGATVVLLYTSDRGLCGAYNTRLNRLLLGRLQAGTDMPDPELIALGRVGRDFFQRRDFPPGRAVVHVSHKALAGLIREEARVVFGRFLAGEVARVFLAYNVYRNPIRQEPRIEPLLPFSIRGDAAGGAGGGDGAPADTREMLFEPSRYGILDDLLFRYLHHRTYMAHLHNEAGENGARMVAMDAATRNAEELIRSLRLQYNRVRQAAITKELIEIVNGARAQ